MRFIGRTLLARGRIIGFHSPITIFATYVSPCPSTPMPSSGQGSPFSTTIGCRMLNRWHLKVELV